MWGRQGPSCGVSVTKDQLITIKSLLLSTLYLSDEVQSIAQCFVLEASFLKGIYWGLSHWILMVPQVNVQLTEKSGSLSDVINKFKKTISDFFNIMRLRKTLLIRILFASWRQYILLLKTFFMDEWAVVCLKGDSSYEVVVESWLVFVLN